MCGTGFLHFKLQIQCSNSVKIVRSAPKIDFYGKNMNCPPKIKNRLQTIFDPFTAISHFRAKGGAFLLTCTKISQNHYFVQFRNAESWGREVKTAQKLDFQGFFTDRVVVPTTRYSVSFALLCETSPKQNTEKLSCRSRFWALAPLFSKFALRFCKNVFEKAFYGGKKVLSRSCALRGVGQQAPPFCHQRPQVECLLID